VCFSPEADVAAGVFVGAVGIDALRHVHRRSELALASLPLLFSIHQFVEAAVWGSLSGAVSPDLGRVATWIYLGFAFGVLPVLVPFAVLGIEPEVRRRRLIAPFCVLGVFVAATLTNALVHGPIGVMMAPYHLIYVTGLRYGAQLTALYVLATCGPLLVSSYRRVVIFGAANLVAIPVLLWLTVTGFVSLWCVWAALTSIAITAHLRLVNGRRAVQSATL